MAAFDVKAVPIDRFTVRDHAEPPPSLGPVVLILPEGAALCHDTRSCTVITGERPIIGEKFVVIISVADIEGAGVGTLAQFTPGQARLFASSMMAAADECDGGQRGVN